MTRYRTSFDTDEQVVVEAFFLALMAPGESEAASVLAEELAAGMDDATVEKCRAAALERFELETERSLPGRPKLARVKHIERVSPAERLSRVDHLRLVGDPLGTRSARAWREVARSLPGNVACHR